MRKRHSLSSYRHIMHILNWVEYLIELGIVSIKVDQGNNFIHKIYILAQYKMHHRMAKSTNCTRWDKADILRQTNSKGPHKQWVRTQMCYSSNRPDIEYKHLYLNTVNILVDNLNNLILSGKFGVGKTHIHH